MNLLLLVAGFGILGQNVRTPKGRLSSESAVASMTPRSSITALAAFGLLCGLAIVLGESLASVSGGAPLKLTFYLFAVPAYSLFGLASALPAAMATNTLSKPRWRNLLGLWESTSADSCDAICLALFLVLAQGGVIVNELVLSGTRFFSIPSLSIDVVWVSLCLLLVPTICVLAKGLPVRVVKTALVLSLVLCSYGLASLYHILDRPATLYDWQPSFHEYVVVAAYTAGAFLLASGCLFLPMVSSRAAAFILKQTWQASLAWSAVAAICALLVFRTVIASVPTVKFDHPNHDAPLGRAVGPNVILLVIDTLRADHLSCYGYHRNTTPNLDSFSKTATLYKLCYSPANWTPPGHASIFTGKFPISHGAHKTRTDQGHRYPTCFPLAKEETTLAELLSENGYVTAAVVANYGFVSKAYGLDQGFQDWFSTPPRRVTTLLDSVANKVIRASITAFVGQDVSYRRANEIVEISLDWISSNRSRPFFLFVNFMDPHGPYSPPSPWDSLFEDDTKSFVPDLENLRNGGAHFSEQQWASIVSQYDGEIAFVDSEIGNFLNELAETGILSDSIIVVTSDHGEFLGEKGLLDHQIGLYEPVIRVPLMIRLPEKMISPLSADRIAQTIDIAPTILDLVGIEIPSGIQGISLLRTDDHPVIAQHYVDEHIEDWFDGRFSTDQLALVTEGMKFISDQEGSEELYDLVSDLGEDRNLAQFASERLVRYRELLRNWRSRVQVAVPPEGVTPLMDAETRQQLEALGYVR